MGERSSSESSWKCSNRKLLLKLYSSNYRQTAARYASFRIITEKPHTKLICALFTKSLSHSFSSVRRPNVLFTYATADRRQLVAVLRRGGFAVLSSIISITPYARALIALIIGEMRCATRRFVCRVFCTALACDTVQSRNIITTHHREDRTSANRVIVHSSRSRVLGEWKMRAANAHKCHRIFSSHMFIAHLTLKYSHHTCSHIHTHTQSIFIRTHRALTWIRRRRCKQSRTALEACAHDER